MCVVLGVDRCMSTISCGPCKNRHHPHCGSQKWYTMQDADTKFMDGCQPRTGAWKEKKTEKAETWKERSIFFLWIPTSLKTKKRKAGLKSFFGCLSWQIGKNRLLGVVRGGTSGLGLQIGTVPTRSGRLASMHHSHGDDMQFTQKRLLHCVSAFSTVLGWQKQRFFYFHNKRWCKRKGYTMPEYDTIYDTAHVMIYLDCKSHHLVSLLQSPFLCVSLETRPWRWFYPSLLPIPRRWPQVHSYSQKLRQRLCQYVRGWLLPVLLKFFLLKLSWSSN